MTAASHPDSREPLSRERVLRAAIALADDGGIESLTMRRLAQALGFKPMALYHHVAGKDDLLNGIVDLIHEEIEPPARGGDWKQSLRRSAISAHRTLVRHPWACNLTMTTEVSTARLRYMEEILATLREAGFSADLTHHAYHALDSHVTGFTLWLVNLPFESDEELAALASSFVEQLSREEYPYLAEHIDQHLLPPDPESEGEFAFGLDLILDGLERLRDTG